MASHFSSIGLPVNDASEFASIAERVLRLVGHPEIIDEPWFATGRERAEHVALRGVQVRAGEHGDRTRRR